MMSAERFLYFAYGSNMLTARLRQRCPSTTVVGRAALGGHMLIWHKKGFRDGSGKCGIEATERLSHTMHGVVYSLLKSEEQDLDRIEGKGHGYDDDIVTVQHDAGALCEVKTYVPTITGRSLQPYIWYKEYVVRGAREHGLPGEYVAALEAVAAIEDPDAERRVREAERLRSFLCGATSQQRI